MDSKKIYEQILAVAKDLVKDGVKYTRADLAYELEKLGVSQDSLDVSRMVMRRRKSCETVQKGGNRT